MAGDGATAIQNPERGVPLWTGARAREVASRLDWDDLKALLKVVDAGGFRAAAGDGTLSVNTLRRRVQRLEESVGATLVRRSDRGTTTTEAGAVMVRAAREMGQAARCMDLGGEARDVLVHPGELRLACTEGLGSIWLTPRLMRLQERLGDLTVSLELDYQPRRERADDVDVGVAFGMPNRPDLVCARLATLHYMLFASEAYLRRHGEPRSFDEFQGHRFVEQAGPGLSPGLMDVMVGTQRPKGFIPIRSNSALSVYWAAVAGAGIAALPTYARAVSSRLRPLQVPMQLRFELWYYYNRDARGSPVVRSALDWLQEAFDPVANPWFSPEFVHPDEFPRARTAKVVNMFDDLLGSCAGDPGDDAL